MKNIYWKVPTSQLGDFLEKGKKQSIYPHKRVHYSIKDGFAIVQGEYTDLEIKSIDKQVYGHYESGKLRKETNFDKAVGINIPWLRYFTRGVMHDGYGTGFHDYYFNATGANEDIKKQLDLMQLTGITHIRLWVNMWHSFNSDKETIGYTGLRPDFLKNISTYLDWCMERDLKVLLCIDDSWYTFPWHWLNTEKEDSYIQAITDLVTPMKSKPALWGWDFCNEPYMGWSSSNSNETKHTHKRMINTLTYDRNYLTRFFKRIYEGIKSVNSKQLCSVGASKPADNNKFGVGDACDFYQAHYYSDTFSVTNPASNYDKPVVVGEFGASNYPHATKRDVNQLAVQRFRQDGYKLWMPWDFSELRVRDSNGGYSFIETIDDFL